MIPLDEKDAIQNQATSVCVLSIFNSGSQSQPNPYLLDFLVVLILVAGLCCKLRVIGPCVLGIRISWPGHLLLHVPDRDNRVRGSGERNKDKNKNKNENKSRSDHVYNNSAWCATHLDLLLLSSKHIHSNQILAFFCLA